MYKRGKKIGKTLKESVYFEAASMADNEIQITIDKRKWEKAWTSIEEFAKLVDDITTEALIKTGIAKDEQEAIRILNLSRLTDGKE